MIYSEYYYNAELYHHGILGQKWGVRRFQNKDGSLTGAGRKRYGIRSIKGVASRATSTLKKIASASKVRIVISDRKKKRETVKSEIQKKSPLSEEEKASLMASGDPVRILAYQDSLSLSELGQALDRANKLKNLRSMSAEQAAQEEKHKKEHGAMATMSKIINGTISAMNTAGKAKDAFDNMSKWWGGDKKKDDIPLTVEDAMKKGLDKLTLKELTDLNKAEIIRDTVKSKYAKLKSGESETDSSTSGSSSKPNTDDTDSSTSGSSSKPNTDDTDSSTSGSSSKPKKSGDSKSPEDYSAWAKKLEDINKSRTIEKSNGNEKEKLKDLLGEQYRLRNEVKNNPPDPGKTDMYRKAIEAGRQRLEELKDAQNDVLRDPSLRYKRNLDPQVLQKKISGIEDRLEKAVARNPSLRLEEVETELNRLRDSEELEKAIKKKEKRRRMWHSGLNSRHSYYGIAVRRKPSFSE